MLTRNSHPQPALRACVAVLAFLTAGSPQSSALAMPEAPLAPEIAAPEAPAAPEAGGFEAPEAPAPELEAPSVEVEAPRPSPPTAGPAQPAAAGLRLRAVQRTRALRKRGAGLGVMGGGIAMMLGGTAMMIVGFTRPAQAKAIAERDARGSLGKRRSDELSDAELEKFKRFMSREEVVAFIERQPLVDRGLVAPGIIMATTGLTAAILGIVVAVRGHREVKRWAGMSAQVSPRPHGAEFKLSLRF